MSGHSHWSTIKHRKEAQDKKKGAAFSRAARLISLAAREGGSDPEMNFELRSAIDKARAVNMPNKSIERAIERGSGAGGDREEWSKVNYEAFGPGQTALIIEGITDNKNRTLDEVKQILNRYGAKLTQPGAVRWLFQQRGRLNLTGQGFSPEEMELKAIEGNALETEWSEDDLIVYVKPEELQQSKTILEKGGLTVKEHSLDWVPEKEVALDGPSAKKFNELLEALSDHDDIQEVYFNADL